MMYIRNIADISHKWRGIPNADMNELFEIVGDWLKLINLKNGEVV